MSGRSLGLVVVAAGSSHRMDGVDKVWAKLDDHPVIWHALSELCPLATTTVVVVRSDSVDIARSALSAYSRSLQIVAGGDKRQESVRRGLEALGPVEIVAVHDAARPFATRSMLEDGLRLLDAFEGAIPVQLLDSTIKMVDANGIISTTLDRSVLRSAQTPQLFRADSLRSAHIRALRTGFTATDCASLLEHFGIRIGTFPGAQENFKITSRFDLEVARLLVRRARAS